MLIRVYASGTNVQRLAKCSKKTTGVIYTAYSQVEQTEPSAIKRKFFCTQVDSLKQEVEQLKEEVMPSWLKIWGRPLANEAFIGELFKALVGQNELRNELNLSVMMDQPVDCFMLLVSANKKEMSQIKQIAERVIPDYHIKVLNGDFTTNNDAQPETKREINEAKIAGKRGVVIIANQMGSRSYSVSEIQATVIAFDRGSVDATTQKASRSLTPGKLYDDAIKTHGAIVDLSFDPNRAENIEKLVLEEAICVQRAGQTADFASAVKYILSVANMFKMNEYGYPIEVTEDYMFKVYNDNETMLKVADMAVDAQSIIDSGMFDILVNVKTDKSTPANKKDIIGEGVKNAVKVGGEEKERNQLKPSDIRKAEEIINSAIQKLNRSATSVYHLAAFQGESYRDCLTSISEHAAENAEFTDLFGIPAEDAICLLDYGALPEALLDVVVQNSKPVTADNLFA